MLRYFAAVIVLFAVSSSATSILWTGYVGDNQWTTNNNWYPNSIPGPNDDVTIEKGNVIVTIPTAVNSLVMGTNVDTPANLTLYHAMNFGTGGLKVKANGNLIQDTGLEAVTGSVTIDGTWTFKSGSASGMWVLTAKGNAYFPGAGQRNIVAGMLTVQGTLYVSGVVGLNQSGVLTNQGNIQGSGELQFMVLDTSGANFNGAMGSLTFAGKVMRFQAPSQLGAVTLSGGNVEVYNTVVFSKDLVIPSGISVSTLGNANVTFGGAVSGAGTLSASGKITTIGSLNVGSVVAAGGNTYLSAGAQAGSFTVSGGTLSVGADVNAQSLTIQGGILVGSGNLIAVTTASLATQGANFATKVTIAGKGTVTGKSLVTFDKQGALIVAQGGSLAVSNGMTVTGPTGTGGFQNYGSVSVDAAFVSQNIDISGNGTFAVSSSLTTSNCGFAANSVSISGTGTCKGSNSALNIQVLYTTSGWVNVVVGDYSLSCPAQCNKVTSPMSPAAYTFTAS